MVRIFKGDDSDFADLKRVTIFLRTELDLTGFTGRFTFLGVERMFPSEEVVTKCLTVSYTAAETATFVPGRSSGSFVLFDTEGRQAATQKVPIEVLTHTTAPCDAEESEIEVKVDTVFDYDLLENKPTLNGVVIQGDKTSGDYRIGDSFVGITVTALTDRCSTVPILVLDDKGTGTPPVRPVNPETGNYVYRRDTGDKFIWDGEAWNLVRNIAGMVATVDEASETLVFRNAWE